MVGFKIRKNFEERALEGQSKIRTQIGAINRGIRDYQRIRDAYYQDALTASHQGNTQKVQLFANNVAQIDSAIAGLEDMKLLLDNVSLTLKYMTTSHGINNAIGNSADILRLSQVSEKEIAQFTQDLEKSMNLSEQASDILMNQIETISSTVSATSNIKTPKAQEIVNSMTENNVQSDYAETAHTETKPLTAEEKRLDDIITQAKKAQEEHSN